MAQQKQRTGSSVETSAPKVGRSVVRSDSPPGRGGGSDTSAVLRSKRQVSGTVRQEQAKESTTTRVSTRSGGAIAPPGPAGSGHSSYSGNPRRFRDRSPSPARRELSRGAIPRGGIQKDGTPKIHPGIAGTPRTSAKAAAHSERRTSTPVQQEAVKAPAPARTPAKGSTLIAHPSPTESGGSSRTRAESKQRTANPVRQEQAKDSAPAGPPKKPESPIVRPGGRPAANPTGTKRQAAPTRTTRAKPGGAAQGGPVNGKPK